MIDQQLDYIMDADWLKILSRLPAITVHGKQDLVDAV